MRVTKLANEESLSVFRFKIIKPIRVTEEKVVGFRLSFAQGHELVNERSNNYLTLDDKTIKLYTHAQREF